MKATGDYLNHTPRSREEIERRRLCDRYGVPPELMVHQTSSHPKAALHGPVLPWEGRADDVLFTDTSPTPLVPAWLWWLMGAAVIIGVLLDVVTL